MTLNTSGPSPGKALVVKARRVLLIWPKARTDPDWGGDLGAIAEPLALEYLAAGLESQGHSVKILDLRLHPNDLDMTVNEFNPEYVGITAFSMHVRAALQIGLRVKAISKVCNVVVGGHHATFLPEDFFEPQIDFVVTGEGVEPFTQLVDANDGGEGARYPNIPGLWYRSNGYFVPGIGNRSLTLDSLPTPARHLTQSDRHRYFIDWMSPVASIRSTMGCPYRCTFCSLWQLNGGRYYRRSVNDFVIELANIDEEFVFLIDDEAFVNKQRMLTLAAQLAESKVRKRIFAYARVDTIIRQREVLEVWRHIGLERLMVGIDATSPKDLVEYNKGYELSQIERALRIADGLDIEILAQFVINTDYHRKDFDRLARFIEHNKIRYPSFTVLTPLPGTPLLANFKKITALQENGRPDWDIFDTQNAVTATAMHPDEFRTAYRALFKKFNGAYTVFRNQAGMRRISLNNSL